MSEEKQIRAKIKQEIYQLNWIKILDEAIKSRPSSWNDNPVREWRNASDEILGALINQMEDKKLIPNFKESTEEYMCKLKGSKE